MHKGIDIQTKHEAVLATEDRGKVVAVNHNTNTGGGKSVTVEYDREDGSKYQCVYMHLDSINVKVGDTVNAGQQLGISGNTGTRTTGEHLHFGVKSISADGTKRDIDPAAYLAEIAQRGNLQQKALYKGNDLIAKYKVENPINTDPGNTLNTNTATNIDANMSPDDWMKKLLSSEDSGVSMSNGDPVIDMAIQLFTSLMMLAVQIDNKNEDEKMEAATDAAVNKVINISSLVPTMKSCTIAVSENGMATLTMNNGQQQFSHVLTNAETSRLSQALNDSGLSQESKQQRVAGIINSIVISQQVSQNYNQAIENQETEQLMRR
jgi:LysM repeat protein